MPYDPDILNNIVPALNGSLVVEFLTGEATVKVVMKDINGNILEEVNDGRTMTITPGDSLSVTGICKKVDFQDYDPHDLFQIKTEPPKKIDVSIKRKLDILKKGDNYNG